MFTRLRGAIANVGHYWKVARGAADESLSRADDAHPFEIASLLILSTVIAVPLTGLLAVLESYVTTSQQPWVRVAGLAPSLLIGLMCLTALTWTAVRAESSPAPERLFALSMLAVVPGVMVALVATAGLFTAVTAPTEVNATPRVFWNAAAYFTWSAVDAIPILEVSELTGWTEVPPTEPRIATWFALVLRLVLLVPLVRVVVASYEWARARHRASDQEWWYADESIRSSALLLAWSMGTLVAALAYGRWMVTPGSTVPKWVGDRVPADVTVASRTVDLTWVPSSVQWAGLAVLLWSGGLALLAFVINALGNRSPVAIGLLLVDWLALIVTGTLLAALLLGRLVQSGLGEVTPDPAPAAGVGISIEFLAWPLVDALPLVEVTDVLHWEVDHSFSGLLVGLVQVGYRLAVVGAVATVPWMAVNLSRRRSDPLIGAAREFAGHLDSIEEELDAARSAPAVNRRRVVAACRATVRGHLGRLSLISRELVRVYGYGEVSRATVLAIEAAREETAATFEPHTWRGTNPVPRRPEDAQTLAQAASAFRDAVVRQHRAADPRRSGSPPDDEDPSEG